MGSCSNWSCSGNCGSGSELGSPDTCNDCNSSGCLGWCTGDCLDSCNDGCSGGCLDSCENTCSGGCSDNCGNNCTGGCTGDCGKGCNTGCSSSEALSLYSTLAAGLNRKIYAADMNNINRMIEIEASSNRFNRPISSVHFSTKTKATSSLVQQLQNNLKAIGQSPNNNAGIKVKAWKSTGQELINLALRSAETKIATDSTG